MKDHDIITIFALRDLETPTEKRTHTVHIEGEVNAPGAYTAEAGETLRDMVMRAGGLTRSAYLFATEFRRKSTRRRTAKADRADGRRHGQGLAVEDRGPT